VCSRTEILDRLVEPGVVAVLRLDRRDKVLPVCEALVRGGIRALEITLTMPEALTALREARDTLGDQTVVGAGSVLNLSEAAAALDAGAEFLVSPVCRPEIVARGHAAGRPVVLGALTPTEVQTAQEAGADLVKLFPADILGPAYCRALLAPMPHLKIIPTGGVNLHAAPEFVKAGCVAVGVGSPLVPPEFIAREDWTGLESLAHQFVEAVRTARKP